MMATVQVSQALTNGANIDGTTMRQAKSLPLLEVIYCDCGNDIRMFTKKPEVTCYRCGHLYAKVDGKWKKMKVMLNKDAHTFGDLLKGKDRRNMVFRERPVLVEKR